MKNLKINDKKIKEVFKRGISLTAMVFTLTTVSGCAEIPADWPNEFNYISQDYNDFKYFNSLVIKEGEAISLYKGEYIAVAINKETYEVKEYIFYTNILRGEIYDLNTGYIISMPNLISGPWDPSIENRDAIFDNCYVVEFVDISNYVEGHELQENYTLEEIRNLEPTIVESIKKMIECKKREKTKK